MFKSINAKFVFAIVITSFMTFGMMVTIAMADSALPTEVATPVESNDEEVLEDFEEDVEDEGDEGSFFDSLFGDEEDTEIEEVFGDLTDNGFVVPLSYEDPTTVRFSVGEACNVVSRVTVTMSEGVNGQILVTMPSENPTEDEIVDSLGMCKFELVDITNDQVESVVWELKAPRQTLVDNDFDRDDMSLILLENEMWDAKRTERIDGDSENFKYTAETNGFGDGYISLARYEGGFFSLQNILLCLGAFIGVILVAAAIYSLMNREEETTISSGENSSNKTNKKNKKNKK